MQSTDSWGFRRVLVVSALAAAGLAVANTLAARAAEKRHPPLGRFITVDGVRLHYTDRGSGPAVVLIHGNIVTGSDYDTSGVVERLLPDHRVIVFDRPGFGYSKRPWRLRPWTAARQGELIYRATKRLGVERAIVAGHSWGSLAALHIAMRHPADVGGLVLLSGYYFWTLRPDVLAVAPAAVPGLGTLLRYTVSPLWGWLSMPVMKAAMFAPAPVTARFRNEFATGIAVRPSQLGAIAVDGTLMPFEARALPGRYHRLSMPVVIFAGEGDRIVFPRNARRVQQHIPGSKVRIIPGAGHMVHHVAPDLVADAIRELAGKALAGPAEAGAVPA